MPVARTERARPQKPAQRRPRADKACNACRTAKQRCEPVEYGKNDPPCRRCSSQGLECNLPRETRSQSPASAQGPASSGTSRNLASGAEPGVQYMHRRSEPPRFPVGSWAMPSIRPEEPQSQDARVQDPARGSYADNTVTHSSPPLPTASYLPVAAAPSVPGHASNLPTVSHERTAPQSFYYPQNYSEQGPSSHPYPHHVVTPQAAPADAHDFYQVVDELETYNAASFVRERDDAGPPNPGES